MKKGKILVFVLIALFFSSINGFAQKFEVGGNMGINNYKNVEQVNNMNYDYTDNIANSGIFGELVVNFFPKETYYFSFGIKSSDFQKIVFVNNVSVKTFDRVLKIPLKFNMRQTLSEKVYWDIGIGVYSGISNKQSQVIQDNSSVQFGFASYTNLGLTASNYLVFCPNSKIGFKIGISTDYDILNLNVKEDVIINYFGLFSMDYGLFIKF